VERQLFLAMSCASQISKDITYACPSTQNSAKLMLESSRDMRPHAGKGVPCAFIRCIPKSSERHYHERNARATSSCRPRDAYLNLHRLCSFFRYMQGSTALSPIARNTTHRCDLSKSLDAKKSVLIWDGIYACDKGEVLDHNHS
jgi:hypothetical protein